MMPSQYEGLHRVWLIILSRQSSSTEAPHLSVANVKGKKGGCQEKAVDCSKLACKSVRYQEENQGEGMWD
jgi:hypothetical protein